MTPNSINVGEDELWVLYWHLCTALIPIIETFFAPLQDITLNV